jgi:hypothetical protein
MRREASVKTQIGVGVAVLSALAAEGKDFSREELNAMLDKLAASPMPKVRTGPSAMCYSPCPTKVGGFECICRKCGTHTVYPKNYSDMKNKLARYRDGAASLRALGLDITLDETVLCSKCKSAEELGLPTAGTIVKRPDKGSEAEKFAWHIGDKVRITEAYDSGWCRVLPASSNAWVSAEYISEKGNILGDGVRIRLAPSLDATVLGSLYKAHPPLKRLPARPGDPADWVRVEWPPENDHYLGYSVKSRFIGDLSYDEKDFVAPCRIDKLAWIINGKRVVVNDDDAKILKAFLTGEKTIEDRFGRKTSLKGELRRLRKLLEPGESDPLIGPFDAVEDVKVEVDI